MAFARPDGRRLPQHCQCAAELPCLPGDSTSPTHGDYGTGIAMTVLYLIYGRGAGEVGGVSVADGRSSTDTGSDWGHGERADDAGETGALGQPPVCHPHLL